MITTPEGARGYPVVDGDSAVMIDREEELIPRVRELLADAPRREALGKAARALAEQYHFEAVFALYGQWIEAARAKRKA